MQSAQLPSLDNIQPTIFTEVKGKIYLGREEIRPEIRELLRDQSKWLLDSQLYEILRSTIINEASQMALIQSTDWDHVLSAKMLWHWNFVLENMIKKLSA